MQNWRFLGQRVLKIEGEGGCGIHITENRIEETLLVRFLLLLLFGQIVEKLRILLGHVAIPQPILKTMSLKFRIQTKFDTLISNLKSYFRHKIVMTSHDIILEKLIKQQVKIHIFIESVSQIIVFLVDTSNMSHFFPFCVKKAKYLKDT